MYKVQAAISSYVSGAILLLGIILIFPISTQAAQSIERIYGENRIETAIEISKMGWDQADTVILARADNPADALSSASLSSAEDAPILLTYSNTLPDSVIDEINRLGASKVYLLGGSTAISQAVQNNLALLPVEIKRIQGANRFETAANINIEAKTSLNSEGIIVGGYSVADALSASSKSAINSIPIYLATKTEIPVNLPSNIKKITIYGGESVIGKDVYDSLVAKGISVTRIAGKNRYDTNLKAIDPSLTETAIIVRGTSTSSESEQYPDAVAGAGLSHKLGANIILSHPTTVIPEVAELLKTNRYPSIFVLGGENAVSTDTIMGLTDYVESTVNKVFNYNIVASAIDPEKPVLYSLSTDDNSIKSYNYLTGESKSLNLTERPEQLYIENNKIYITLVHGLHSSYWWDEEQTGEIAIVDAASFQLIKKIAINLDPFDIVADPNGYIYVSGGSGQWTSIKSYSETTGAEVSSANIRQQSYIEIKPDKTKIYAVNTDVYPRDISQYFISAGKFTGNNDSPYHGDYDLAPADLRVSPDGRFLFNSIGHVFTENLSHAAELEVPFNDIAFDLTNGRFFTGIEDVIFQHQYHNFEIDNYFLTSGEVIQMYQKNGKLYILTLLTNETTGLQNFALETMDLPTMSLNSYSSQKDPLLNQVIEKVK